MSDRMFETGSGRLLLNRELKFAIEVVRIAGDMARRIQAEMVSHTLTKEDRSPVTVGDFAVQALVGRRLQKDFPDDPLVAEESSAGLADSGAATTLEAVTHFVRELEPGAVPEDVLQWVDQGTQQTSDRFWVLDPIDGTKGFLRGDQYAVCLALVENGQVQIGVLACPQLQFPIPAASGSASQGGLLAAASRGEGAWWTLLEDDRVAGRLKVSSQSDPGRARVLRSFESGHTDVEQMAKLMFRLGVRAAPVLMDSQAKYATLAAAEGDLLFRLVSPDNPLRKEKIWDHAAGSLIVQEAGGQVTDLDGQPLDFSAGRKLARNRGILASNGLLHAAALEVLRAIEETSKRQTSKRENEDDEEN